MTYPRTVTAQLLDATGAPVSGTPLANAFDVSFYDELNGPGHGNVSLSLSEAGSAQLIPGRYVNCLVEGTVRFTFKIEGRPSYKVIQRGEEHDQIMTVSGRGWACLMDDAITYPEYDLKFMIGTSWRLFSFASPAYVESWPAAHEVHEYLEGVTTRDCYGHTQIAPDGIWYPSPIGFPWPTNPFNLAGGVPTGNYVDTFWIRPPASVMSDPYAPGYYLFRGAFTVGDTSSVTFSVTGDNFFTLFIEGVPILGEEILNGDALMWQGWKEQTVVLPAGTYTVAAAVFNVSWADLGSGTAQPWPACPAEGWAGGTMFGSPGGLIFAAYIDGDGVSTPPTYILTSDATWVSMYDPDTWPGWTPGEIIQKLIDEALPRGAIAVYNSNTFTGPNDSNGDAWRPAIASVTRPDLPTFAVEVWSTLMHALEELDSQGWINWHVRPGTWILDVTRGRAPASPSSAATLAAGVNLIAFERSATAPYANALMVQWEGGYVVVEDAAAITAYGTRVEDGYSTDAPSEAEAILQGENELLRRAQNQYPAIVAVVEPVSAADCPYEAFATGSYVTAPASGGGTELIRCLSIKCDQDEMGYAVWTTELNAKLDVPERKTTRLLQQLGGRNQVVRGSVQT